MSGHFDFVALDGTGAETKEKPVQCTTDSGVILQCPAKIDVKEVRHLCSIARLTPNVGVDLSLWEGGFLLWSARIYWRE